MKTMHNMDIYCPNFDHYLQLKIENITPSQFEALYDSVQVKIHKYKGESVHRMSWAEKMHVLSVGFNNRIVICTVDENDGIGVKDFNTAIKAQDAKIKNSKLLDQLQENAIFVQGDKEVMQALLYMNHTQTTGIYNLLRMNNPREKSKKEKAFDKKFEELKYIIDTFIQYEGNKKKVVMQFGLTPSKLYGLLFFFAGERKCKDFYDGKFKYSYSKDRGELSKSLAEMYRSGLLSKRGTTRELKYSITSKGIDLLVKVLNKLLYDV